MVFMIRDRVEEFEKIMSHLVYMEGFGSCPEALNRLEYLYPRATIVTPYVDSSTKKIVALEEHPAGHQEGFVPLRILPLFKSDASLDQEMASHVERTRYANYCCVTHQITLNVDAAETRLFIATSLLHELGHAQLAEKERRIGDTSVRNPFDRLQEELKMWLFDCRLAQAMGGRKLEREINKTIAQYAARPSYKPQPGVGKPLDYCYRPVADKQARGFRDSMYLVFCGLISAKRYLKPDEAHYRQLQIINEAGVLKM